MPEDIAWQAHLHFTSPEVLRDVFYKTTSPVALDTCDDVVASALNSFRNNTEAVVLHDRRTADAAEEALLNALLELDDCYAGGWLEGVFIQHVGTKDKFV